MKKSAPKSGKSRVAIVAVIVAVIAVGLAVLYFYHRQARIRNVVLISIDTCRADHLSCYGYKRQTTPHIDAVARDGVMFTGAMSPVPLTTPAHCSMLTGTYPPTHGVRINDGTRLAESRVTLAEIMHNAGYQTAAFVGAFPLDSKLGLNKGFDTYDCDFARKSDMSAPAGERSAQEVSRPAMDWLDRHGKKPFLLFLHYFDPHLPYSPPEPYATDYRNDLYSGEIAYVDIWIGHVLDRLRELGVYDNTLVVITGDHGESLGEHGERAHGFFIYQSTLHVPLVIRAPKHGKDLRVDGNVSLVDIVPTVLDLLGLKTPAQVDGVSLASSLESGAAPARSNPIYSESLEASTYDCGELYGVVEAQWKHILAQKQELYDLASDSNEQRNAIEQQPQVAHQLRSRLEAMLKVMESKSPKGAGAPVDREAVKRLQSLGYVGGGATPGAAAFDPAREDPKDFLAIYERLLKADGLVRSKRREEALKELLEIVKERPGLAAAHFNLAVLLQEMGKSGEASDHFAEALRLRHDYKEAHFKLGTLLQMAGKLPEAIDHYEQALRGQPDDADVLCNLGGALQQMGKLPEAIAHYEQCLLIRPEDADAHYNLGSALQQMGRLPEAIVHYEQCLLIRPDYARVNSGISALVAAREAVNTMESLEQTLKAFPQNVEAHVKLGNVLRKTGRVPDAIIRYEQALRITPESVEAHYNLAVALVQAGKLKDAVGHYAEAVRVNPSFLPGLNNLAWIRATSDDPQLRDGAEAVRLSERACQLTGRKQFPPLDILAAAYAEAGRFPEAVEVAQEASALATSVKREDAASQIAPRLALYRAGRPYRSSQQANPSSSKQ